MNERIKKLRKALDLTQQEFANRIGVKRNTVATYEMGRSIPSDAALTLICREFKVNDEWLRTGNGEMFVAEANDALDKLARDYNLSHGDYIFIEKFLKIKPEGRQVILDFMLEFAAAVNVCDTSIDEPAFGNLSENEQEDLSLDIEAEVAAYRAELEAQEKSKGKLLASDGTNAI